MSETTNICPQCGGQKTLYIKVEQGYSDGRTVSGQIAQFTTSTVHLCLCPLQEKHNGNLDKTGKVRVCLDTEVAFEDECVHLDVWYDRVSLMASEALSLLAWLRQEEATLQQLKAKEHV